MESWDIFWNRSVMEAKLALCLILAIVSAEWYGVESFRGVLIVGPNTVHVPCSTKGCMPCKDNLPVSDSMAVMHTLLVPFV